VVVAGLGALGAAPHASASIVYIDFGSLEANNATPIYVDVLGGQASSSGPLLSANFILRDFDNKPYKPSITSYTSTSDNGISLGSGLGLGPKPYVAKLNFGDLISGSNNPPTIFNNSPPPAYFAGATPPGPPTYPQGGAWAGSGVTTGYMGFEINASTTPLYGWLNVSYNGANGDMTLNNGAYETTGAPIQAGVVPEPADSAVLAAALAGSAVLFARRRRRQAA